MLGSRRWGGQGKQQRVREYTRGVPKGAGGPRGLFHADAPHLFARPAAPRGSHLLPRFCLPLLTPR